MFMAPNNEDYLVQLDSANSQFPYLCPICRKSAERTGIISKSVKGFMRKLPPSFSLRHWSVGAAHDPTHLRRSIHVPICEDHLISYGSKEKIRPACIVVNSFSIVTTMFVGFLIIAASIDQFMIGFQWFLFLEMLIIISVTSLVWLRPSELERAVSIIRIEPGTSMIVLRLKHKWYLDEILRLNPESTKRVKVLWKEHESE